LHYEHLTLPGLLALTLQSLSPLLYTSDPLYLNLHRVAFRRVASSAADQEGVMKAKCCTSCI